MTFRACLLGNIDTKHQRRSEAEAVLERYDARVKDLTDSGVSPERADMTAAEEIAASAADEAKWAKARRLKDAQVQIKQTNRIMGAARPGKELSKIFSEIEGVSHGYLRHFHAMMVNFLDTYESKHLGFSRETVGLAELSKELYGESSGSAGAKGMADVVREFYAANTKLARANGVNMVDDPKFHMPQNRGKGKMKDQGEWVADHNEPGILDWDSMKSFNDGKVIPVEQREAVLNRVYDTITTDGINKATFDYKADMGVAARLTQKRFLRYANSDSWNKMNDKYGAGSLADSLIDFMSSASRDLAQLQVLGPNPGTTKVKLQQAVKVRTRDLVKEAKTAKVKNRIMENAKEDTRAADDVYGFVTGRNADVGNKTGALLMSSLRTGLSGALLGKAVLSAVPGDIATMRHVAQYSGHSSMEPVKRYMKMMNPLSSKHRDFAKRSIVINEMAMGSITTAERFGGDPAGPKWMRKMSEAALRATGLTHHTEIARWATSMELSGSYADSVKIDFKDLEFRERFEINGITKEDWDVLRSTVLTDFDGSKFLITQDLLKREDLDLGVAQDVYAKFSAYETDFLELAVPTATVEAKAALLNGTRAGTWTGELARSVAMFKNFPVTIMMKHWRDGMAKKSRGDKAAYLASFLAYMTAGGALSEQMHTLSKGEHLQSMNPLTPEGRLFYARAMARGGGLSLMADFLVSDTNRYGSGFFNNLIGPAADFGDKLSKATWGQAQKAWKGEDTDMALQIAKLLRTYTPGSHIWYLDRVITALTNEFIFQELDPKFHSKARKKVRKLRKEEKRGYWWGPTELTPQRAPQFSGE